MKPTLKNVFFAGIVLVCAGAAFAQHVKTDYDRNADFSHYKTYRWRGMHSENGQRDPS